MRLVNTLNGSRLGTLGLCLALCVLLCGQSLSQEAPLRLGDFAGGFNAEVETAEEDEEFLETDRNAFTFSRLTPGAGGVVFEASYSFLDFGSEGAKHSFPESLVRVGVGDRFELRFGYNYETGSTEQVGEGNLASNFGIDAEQQVYYGFKYQVSRRDGWFPGMPDSAFLAQAHTPFAGGQSQYRMGYAWGWTLPNGWDFDQAFRFGSDREEEDGYMVWAPSVVLKIPLGRNERLFTHIEYFSIMSQANEADFSKQFVDTGLHYFVTPNFEVGTIVGFGINEQTEGIFVNVGCGSRF